MITATIPRTNMSDERERWLNVAQAAQWLAEGRAVEYKNRPSAGFQDEWTILKHGISPPALYEFNEYRLRPEPRKPRVWTLELQPGHPSTLCAVAGPCDVRPGQRILVREVIGGDFIFGPGGGL